MTEIIVRKGLVIRLYPTEEQKIFLNKSFGCERLFYNYLLNERNVRENEKKKFLKGRIFYVREHLKSALKHTLSVFIYIFILTLLINIVVEFVGEDNLKAFMSGTAVFEPVFASIIGLIPNCASSVIITELYLSEIISFGSIIAGLLVNAGAGLLMLFRINRNIKENIAIVLLLYVLGAVTGIIINLIGVTI